MPREESLKSRYEAVRARIDAAAARGGRRGEDVVLVAVTKFASIEQIRELIALGHVDLGESRAQILAQHAAQVEEFLQRHRELPMPLARLIHSVDSLRLAEEIQTAASRLDEPVEVLVQVNVAGERSKHGIAPAAAKHLIEQIDTMLNIRVRGLMCMAPIVEEPAETRPVFTRAGELFEDIKKLGIVGDRFDILSMGMSADYEVAVECGANIVRVGSAIFGEPEPAPE
jgi:pyridoxal phosphate enzyme (YggS family)